MVKSLKAVAMGAVVAITLVGCAAPQQTESEAQVTEFDQTIQAASYRDQIVPSLVIENTTSAPVSKISALAALRVPGGHAPSPAWLMLQVANDFAVDTSSDSLWKCTQAEVVDDSKQILCNVDADTSADAIKSGLPFTLTAPARNGLFGITLQAGYGQPSETFLEWESIAGRSDSTRSLIKVVSTPKISSVKQEFKPASLRLIAPKTKAEHTEVRASVVSDIRPELILSSNPQLDSFCLLYAAVGLSGGTLSAGPVVFSNLGNSSKSVGSCDSSSVITLTSADIQLAGVTFSNVKGIVTPSTITFISNVAKDEVQLTISGPYPQTGALYSATAQFAIGASAIVATGSVDYSQSNLVSVTLGVSASSLNWSPLPGFSLAAAGASGKFVRSGSGSSAKDTFDLSMDFSGNWNPIGTVSAKTLSVDLSNASGDLVAKIDTSLSGGISVSDLNLSLAGLAVDGSLDLDSGRTELDVNLGKLSIGSVASINQATATLVYDPTKSSGGNSAFVSGNASFATNLKSFFAGDSIATTIEFSSAGYLVSAQMQTTPNSAGFQLSSLQFVYTSLIDPTVPFEYAPSYPGTSGILIPLANESPLVIGVSRGLPSSFATALKTLDINVIDPAAVSVVAIELPPGVPKLSVYYAAPSQPYLIGQAGSSTYVRFDDIYLSIAAGAEDTFTIDGDVTLHTSGTDLLMQSALTVSVSETGAGIDGSLELVDSNGWNNAFDVNGLTVFDLLIQAGMDDGLPSFGVEAKAAFPSSVTAPLGIVAGSVITLGLDLSATTPCAVFSINAPSSNPKANVISLDGGNLTASDAQMILAPEGCQLGQVSYSGYAMNFDGKIRGVGVGFATTFTLAPAFSLEGSGYIGTFPMGSVTMEKTTAQLSINAMGFSLVLSGGLNAGTSIQATGTALLSSTGGFTFDGEGKVFINGNGSDITVHATDCKDIACSQLTDPSFNITGKIIENGFEFDAALAADAKGEFTAKLTIPNQSHDFSFSHSNPKVDGNGTFTYTISVEVSNVNVGEIDFSGSVKLKSCKMVIVFTEDCSGSKVTWVDKISPGSVAVTITVDISGQKFSSSLKL